MLQLRGEQVESLWDEVLPDVVRELPEELARIDQVLDDPAVYEPIVHHWRDNTPRGLVDGRPTIPMRMYVRLMVLKHRHGWGYETLMREVSDSLHLRRFCGISIDQKVPDESTPRKLTRRLGAETVNEISRVVIAKATRETRFRPRAVRIDSTVVEADVRYPTDPRLARDAAKMLAGQGRRARRLLRAGAVRVRDRSRAIDGKVRELGRTLKRRTGQAKEQVLKITGEAGETLKRSVREARRLSAQLRESARGRGARAKQQAAEQLERIIERAAKVAEQIDKRVAGEKITDRIVSMSDPDARPIRKGKLNKPNEFGYVKQLAEVTPNTRRGARGFLLPAASLPGNPAENELLGQTVEEIQRLDMNIREVAVDGGFGSNRTLEQLAPIEPERVYISGKRNEYSKRTNRRLGRYRVGAEGRISHSKRSYGLRRSRLKGYDGSETWTAWGNLAYNLDTYAVYA